MRISWLLLQDVQTEKLKCAVEAFTVRGRYANRYYSVLGAQYKVKSNSLGFSSCKLLCVLVIDLRPGNWDRVICNV